MGFPGGSGGKESTCNARDAGDMGSIPELGRPPGGGHGNPLQHSCLEHPVDRGAWRVQSIVSQSWTQQWTDRTAQITHTAQGQHCCGFYNI